MVVFVRAEVLFLSSLAPCCEQLFLQRFWSGEFANSIPRFCCPASQVREGGDSASGREDREPATAVREPFAVIVSPVAANASPGAAPVATILSPKGPPFASPSADDREPLHLRGQDVDLAQLADGLLGRVPLTWHGNPPCCPKTYLRVDHFSGGDSHPAACAARKSFVTHRSELTTTRLRSSVSSAEVDHTKVVGLGSRTAMIRTTSPGDRRRVLRACRRLGQPCHRGRCEYGSQL
jgi:hypothetical protein